MPVGHCNPGHRFPKPLKRHAYVCRVSVVHHLDLVPCHSRHLPSCRSISLSAGRTPSRLTWLQRPLLPTIRASSLSVAFSRPGILHTHPQGGSSTEENYILKSLQGEPLFRRFVGIIRSWSVSPAVFWDKTLVRKMGFLLNFIQFIQKKEKKKKRPELGGSPFGVFKRARKLLVRPGPQRFETAEFET